jgi:hypothetical protein
MNRKTFLNDPALIQLTASTWDRYWQNNQASDRFNHADGIGQLGLIVAPRVM